MSFPAYEEYKDGGGEWLGEVPEGWEVQRVKHAITSIEQGWSPQCENERVQSDEQWGVLKVGCVNYGKFTAVENKALPPALEPQPELGIREGDLLISRANTVELVGSAAVAECDHKNLMLCDKLYRLRMDHSRLLPEFLCYFLTCEAAREPIELGATGASPSMKNIAQSVILELWFTAPEVTEQRTIASFLDSETSKIDSLVSEQRRLIELLREKRQAVISHAVTKGLNPNAPMKPSGIQWLGDVPQHWEVGPLKRFWSVTDCKHVTAEFVDDGGIPLASIREVQSKWVQLDAAKRTTQGVFDLLIDGGREPQVGDLIFSRNATVGEVAQVGEHTPRFAMGQDVCLFRRLHDDSSPDYWQHILKSTEVVEQISVLMVGATFKRINVDEIRNLSVVSPPLEEQKEIAEFLDVKVERFDSLVAEAERAIELLQERRTALISAAVTGKIDVRECAYQETA